MSHMVTTKTVVRDLEALRRAAARLGGKLREGQTTFCWYGQFLNDYDAYNAAYHHGIRPEDYGKCSHALVFPHCNYEVGVVNNPSGDGYLLVWDDFEPGGLKPLFDSGPSLHQLYAAEAVKLAAQQQGKLFDWEEFRDETTGDLKLIARAY